MLGKIYTTIINLLLVALLGLGLLMVASIFPIFGDIKSFSVQSGSMEPTISTGSLIFVRPAEPYGIGDIVTRTTDNADTTITHRIVDMQVSKGEAVNYITQGDANNAPDAEAIEPEQIIGKTFLSIPYLGYAVNYAKTPIGFILLVIIPATIIIYSEIRNIDDEVRKKWKKRKERETDTETEDPYEHKEYE